MRSLTFILFFAWITLQAAIGQTVQEGYFEFYKKITPNAAGLTRAFSEVSQEEMIATIQQRFAKQYNARHKTLAKNLFYYEGLIVPEISQATLNYYFRVDKPNKKTGMSAVTLFISPGYDNFYASSRFPAEMEAASRFLNSLPIEAQKLALEGQLQVASAGLSEEEQRLGKLQKQIQVLDKKAVKQEQALAKTKDKRAKIESQALEIQNRMQDKETEVQRIQQTIRSVEGNN